MKKFGNIYVDDFLMEKSVNQGISDRMVEIYITTFRLLDTYKNIALSDLTTYTTQNFKRFLGENFLEKKWSSKTYNHYRTNLRCYCGYLKDEGYLEENPFDNIQKRKEPKRLPRTLSTEQVKELLSSLSTTFNTNTFLGIRNKTIVYLYLYSGMRLSELTNLKIENIKIHDGLIQVLKGKGDKERHIPLTKEIIKSLFNYLKERRRISLETDYVFPTIYGNCLQKKDMQRLMNQIREKITFHFTWHQLRHTYATELVKNNFDIYNISQILGHSSTDTTKVYLKVDVYKLKKQLDKIKLFSY